ncbi:MAG: protoporphyrinogen oxidase-like protein [Candidatus Acidiferrum sp.]|jgi:protoporphyrinogen oxidase
MHELHTHCSTRTADFKRMPKMKQSSTKMLILGAGVTGLAAGWVSGLPVYEAEEAPGGICSSYYLRPGNKTRLHSPPDDGEAYRFEVGGGHWIFGGDALILQFIESLTPLKSYDRRSSVYFPDRGMFVPYPLQNNLKYLDPEIIEKALREMAGAAHNHRAQTMAEWLEANFGRTLYDLFFGPFHELYTAGLWKSIAPQDAYKSPVNLSLAIEGAFNHSRPVGYNTRFVYPAEGLNALTQRIASRSDIRYGKRVAQIDARRREVFFADGSGARYEQLLSTLPLNRMMDLTGLSVEAASGPSPSVLVINLGAHRGPTCPEDHWVYVPHSNCGFHRVGFYSNVDASFLPASARKARERVSIYVEKAFAEGQRPSSSEVSELSQHVVEQLQQWGWIAEVETIDPTWIDVAYTWSRPGSNWKQLALQTLEKQGIYPVGRYARWVFQGIADSIRDGLLAGAAASNAAYREITVSAS